MVVGERLVKSQIMRVRYYLSVFFLFLLFLLFFLFYFVLVAAPQLGCSGGGAGQPAAQDRPTLRMFLSSLRVMILLSFVNSRVTYCVVLVSVLSCVFFCVRYVLACVVVTLAVAQ